MFLHQNPTKWKQIDEKRSEICAFKIYFICMGASPTSIYVNYMHPVPFEVRKLDPLEQESDGYELPCVLGTEPISFWKSWAISTTPKIYTFLRTAD